MRELDSLLVDAIKSGNASESEIKAIEEKFVVRLPNSYRQFLKRYGSISISDITIFGLAVPDIQLPSLVYALQVLRAHWPDVPTNLVPIESLSSGEFACLWCDDATVASPVVYWNLNIPTTEQLPTILSPDFTDYLYERLMQWNHREIGLQRLE